MIFDRDGEPSLEGFPAAVVGAYEMYLDLLEQFTAAETELVDGEAAAIAAGEDDEEIERSHVEEVRRRLSVVRSALDEAGDVLIEEVEKARRTRHLYEPQERSRS